MANNNQVGVIARFNTGFRFNAHANNDLNRVCVAANDRPLFIGRNTATSDAVKQIAALFALHFDP
jgi:hypothetical protein